MSVKKIKVLAASFESALRVMGLLVPSAGIENVSISPCEVGNGWFVDISDHGIGLAEMIDTKMVSASNLGAQA